MASLTRPIMSCRQVCTSLPAKRAFSRQATIPSRSSASLSSSFSQSLLARQRPSASRYVRPSLPVYTKVAAFHASDRHQILPPLPRKPLPATIYPYSLANPYCRTSGGNWFVSKTRLCIPWFPCISCADLCISERCCCGSGPRTNPRQLSLDFRTVCPDLLFDCYTSYVTLNQRSGLFRRL